MLAWAFFAAQNKAMFEQMLSIPKFLIPSIISSIPPLAAAYTNPVS